MKNMNEILKFLETNGIKIKDFCKNIGISKSMFSRIKSGNRNFSVKLSKRIEIVTMGAIRAIDLLGIEYQPSRKSKN